MSGEVRIALDAMGGDGAPKTPVAGAAAAIADSTEDFHVLLVGDPAAIETELAGFDSRDRLEILPASQTIGPNERPVFAVRRKRDSSIVVGLRAVESGEADAFISAGSTGAVMAASVFILGALPGVYRPPVAALFPTMRGPTLVLDVGANISPRPHHLHQFAHLGSIYIRDLLGIENPRVGLLNVGEEMGKGGDLAVATYRLLEADTALNFVGNVEGHEIIEGACDVLVCEGFAGNVLVKFYESMAGTVLEFLDEKFAQARAELEQVFRFLDYTEFGGAPLLGVNGVTIICHGASQPRAIANAIGTAVMSSRSGIVADMARDLEGLPRWWRRPWRPRRRV